METEVGGLQALRNWGAGDDSLGHVAPERDLTLDVPFHPLQAHRSLFLSHSSGCSKCHMGPSQGKRQLCGRSWTGDVISLSPKFPI